MPKILVFSGTIKQTASYELIIKNHSTLISKFREDLLRYANFNGDKILTFEFWTATSILILGWNDFFYY